MVCAFHGAVIIAVVRIGSFHSAALHVPEFEMVM